MAEAVRRGLLPRLPPRVANAPRLLAHLEIHWLAFKDLSTCRPPAFGGVAPIPFTAVLQYAAFKGLSHEQTEELDYFMGRMDDAFMSWYAEREARNARSNGAALGQPLPPQDRQIGGDRGF